MSWWSFRRALLSATTLIAIQANGQAPDVAPEGAAQNVAQEPLPAAPHAPEPTHEGRRMVSGDTVYIYVPQPVYLPADTVYLPADTMYMDIDTDEEQVWKRSDEVLRKRKERWEKLIPDYSKLQYAGGMGLMSLGAGWEYGRKLQWETDIFIGFVPSFHNNHTTLTFTLKQNYIPWRVRLSSSSWFEPLETGMYVNYISSKKFWGVEPQKYGGSYYKYMQDLRFNIFVGQRITLDLHSSTRSPIKALTFFYEASTNDLYLISAIPNKKISVWDIMVFSLGLKIHFE